MTINYSLEVATADFGTFLKLLLRWHGSMYKFMYKELIIFFTAYFALSFVYRFALNAEQQA